MSQLRDEPEVAIMELLGLRLGGHDEMRGYKSQRTLRWV